jgi:hypothetical protein
VLFYIVTVLTKIMKTSGILITGAMAILAIAVSSCATTGTHTADEAVPAPVAPASKSDLPPVPVSLVQYFNQQGIYPDGAQFSGGVDGDGFACSSNLLAVQTWHNVPFQLGASIGGSNVITCRGQTIALGQTGHFSKLEMLAFAVNGAQENQDFSVIYGDNSTAASTLSVSDWAQPGSYTGETVATTMEYRIQSDGSKDENAFYIYRYSFDLDSGKTLQSLKLPDNDNIKIFALTLMP